MKILIIILTNFFAMIATNNGGNATVNITLQGIPQNLAQLQAMPQARLTNEFEAAALCVAVLANYNNNPAATIEMLNYLRGPRPMQPREVQFVRDRLAGKPYKMMSFFNGTSPQNDYRATLPLTVRVSTNPHSYDQPDMVTLYLHSSGADSPRPIQLRRKPSTGQWFVWEMLFLSDIRVPVSQDPWA